MASRQRDDSMEKLERVSIGSEEACRPSVQSDSHHVSKVSRTAVPKHRQVTPPVKPKPIMFIPTLDYRAEESKRLSKIMGYFTWDIVIQQWKRWWRI